VALQRAVHGAHYFGRAGERSAPEALHDCPPHKNIAAPTNHRRQRGKANSLPLVVAAKQSPVIEKAMHDEDNVVAAAALVRLCRRLVALSQLRDEANLERQSVAILRCDGTRRHGVEHARCALAQLLEANRQREGVGGGGGGWRARALSCSLRHFFKVCSPGRGHKLIQRCATSPTTSLHNSVSQVESQGQRFLPHRHIRRLDFYTRPAPQRGPGAAEAGERHDNKDG
jgi:hypothetical protein